ncbi:hypothetical protein WDU94_002314 [Cyamophila willieti]
MCFELDDIKKVVTDFEAEKNRAVCENEHLKQEICGFKRDISELQRINDKLCDDLEESDRCIKKLQNENAKLEECVQRKDMEICELEKLFEKVEELKVYVCQLERELEKTNKQMCCLEDQITELSRCVQEKDFCIRRLENKIRNLEGMICELEDTIKCLSDENRSLKCQLDECRQCLDRTNKELECMCQRLKQCECEKHILQCQVQELQQCLDDTNNKLQREVNCNCKLKDELKRLQEENHKLCVSNAFLQEENCELVKKLDCCNRNLKSCQCEYDRVQQECDAFKKSIGEFKNQIVTEIKCNVPCPPPCPVIPRRARSVNVPNRKRSNRTPRSTGLYDYVPCPPCKRPESMNTCNTDGLLKTVSFSVKIPRSISRGGGCHGMVETPSAKYRKRLGR